MAWGRGGPDINPLGDFADRYQPRAHSPRRRQVPRGPDGSNAFRRNLVKLGLGAAGLAVEESTIGLGRRILEWGFHTITNPFENGLNNPGDIQQVMIQGTMEIKMDPAFHLRPIPRADNDTAAPIDWGSIAKMGGKDVRGAKAVIIKDAPKILHDADGDWYGIPMEDIYGNKGWGYICNGLATRTYVGFNNALGADVVNQTPNQVECINPDLNGEPFIKIPISQLGQATQVIK